MPDGSLTFIPDPSPGASPAPLTFDPDPLPIGTALAPASGSAPLTFIPDPLPEPAAPMPAPVVAEPAAPPAQTPLSSIYDPATGVPGAESLGDIFGPPMSPTDRDLEGQRATAMATMPGPVAPPPPGTLSNWLGLPGPAAPLGPAAPPVPDTGEGFISGLGSGYQGMLRNYARTFSGQAFTPDPTAPPEPKERTWLNELGYGLGASPVVLGGGIGGGLAGGTAGAAVGGPPGAIAGTIIGSGLGMGLPALVETLGPSYQAAMQRPGTTHDQAVDYAINRAIATGGITAATAPLFVLTPVKGAIGRILYQSFVGMPAAGGATRIGVPAVMGDPLPSLGELAQGASHDVVMGLGFGLGHAAGSRIINGPAPVPPVPATSPVDLAARARLAPGPVVGQEFATERAGVPAPPPAQGPIVAEAPIPPREVTRTELAPEQFPPTAAPPTAGEPYAQQISPTRIEPAPAAEVPAPPGAPATRALSPEPPVLPGPDVVAPVPPAAQEPAPSVRSEPAVEIPVPAPPSLRPPEPVIGEPVDRPGGTPGRPGEPAPVGEGGPAPVAGEPGAIPGGPRVGAGPGERPPDIAGARPGEQPAAQPAVPAGEARPAVGAEPPIRETPEAPAAEAAPVVHSRDDYRSVVGGTYSLSPEDKATLATAIERAVAERGGVTFEDLPREITDKLATDQITGLKAHLGNPDLVLDVLRGDTSRVAPSTQAARPALTTEPDDAHPGQHVAKNSAGEVVGKGASPEAALADAQARQNAPYASEAPAKPYVLQTGDRTEARLAGHKAALEGQPNTVPERFGAIPDAWQEGFAAGVVARERRAPAPEAPAKRPVTKAELEALDKRVTQTGQALTRAERDRATTPERLDVLRQRYEEARAARDNAEGPPTQSRDYRLPQPGDKPLTREQIRENTQRENAAHEAAVAAHEAAIDRRVHAEGTDPTPEPGKAGAVFSMGGSQAQSVVRGTDSAGNTWIGTGHAMVKGDTLTRAANQALKRSGTTERPVAAEGLTKVTTPDPKADYQPVTWERQVTDPFTGNTLVIGTRPDGTFVAVQKPIYDALHAAAGKGGTIVARTPIPTDARVLARNAAGETTGVGMPIRVDEAQARIWARGRDQAVVLPEAGRAPGPREEAGTTGPRTEAGVLSGEGERFYHFTRTGEIHTAERTPGGPGVYVMTGEDARYPGQRLEVEVRGADADSFLDWGGSIQNERVQKVVREHLADEEEPPRTGQDVFNTLRNRYGEAEAVKILRDNNILGSKAGSEYAVFNPADVVRRAETTDPTLTKLQATRDALINKVRTPAEERKLNTVNQQIARREAALEKARAAEAQPRETQDLADQGDQTQTQERRGGRNQPFTGPPEVGRARDLLDYKFNDGTSVFREVFREAGHDPDLAVSWGPQRQVEVLTQHLSNKFGFTGVEVVGARGRAASRVQQHQAVQAMLDTTRALTDGMASMGLPHDAASLGGTLKLEIVPAGSTNYFGAYVFDGTIKVQAGANSYGHEWTHAIDHILAEQFTNNPRAMNDLLSRYARNTGLDTSNDVQAAFAKLINTMFYDDAALAARHLALTVDAQKVDKAGNPTKKALDAQEQLIKLEGAGSKLRIHSSEFRRESQAFHPPKADYWGSVYEMLARSHEAYLADLMTRSGRDPRGFVMPDEAYLNMVDRQLRMAYPKGPERLEIFKAWDEVHHAMRRDQILDAGKPPGDKADYGISDNYRWRSTAPNANKTTLGQKVSAEINSIRNFSQTIRERSGVFDPNRPKAPQPLSQRFADHARMFYKATRGMMKIIIARAPDEAKAILQPIADSVATDPGSGRRTNENFHEAVERKRKTWNFQYGNIKQNHGYGEFNPMTAEEGRMLRHLLTGGSRDMPNDPSLQSPGTTRIPDKIVKLQGDVRQLLNELWSISDKAGLDIGYAKNGYFPRHYDRFRAAADPTGFRRDASELYSLMFDQELGAPGSNPQALLEKWTTLPRESRELAAAKAGSVDMPAQMRELQKNILRQREIEENPAPTPAERAELNTLKGDAQQLAADLHPLLRDYIAEANAASWHANLKGGGLHDFDTASPTGNHLQARVLPPEADHIMRNFMEQDPEVALPAYFNAVARRSSFAEQFGPKGEVLEKAKEALARIDGMDGLDTAKFFDLIDDVTGRNARGGMARWLQVPHNMVQAAGAMVLMERAMWSSLHEPMAAALVTGDIRAGLSTLGKSIGQLVEAVGIGNQAARDRTALAEFLSVITSPQYDSTMLSRMGAAYDDSPRMGRLLGQFYRTTGLTQLTNGQRAASVGTSNWFVNKLSQNLLSKETGTAADHARDNATRWFNELGLPETIHQDFAQWMVDQGGKLPTPEMLAGKQGGVGSNINAGMADAYSLAMRRLVDRIIQDPKPVDRSLLANVPGLGLAFQLMSFNYSFHENVLTPAARRIMHNFTRARGEAEAAGSSRAMANVKATFGTAGTLVNTLAIATAMVGAATMTGIIRQLLFNPDQLKKHADDGDLVPYLLRLGLSRSGLYGKWDPVQQTFNHLKYDSDISSLVHGAAINWFGKNAQDALTPLLGGTGTNAAGTNTAEFNQARAVFNLAGIPAAAYGLTLFGSMGPISRVVAGIALQLGTSPAAGNLAGYLWAGPKGATLPTRGSAGRGALAPLPRAGGALPKIGGRGGAAPAPSPSGFNGLIGDVAIPAVGYAAPAILNAVPGLGTVGKIGAGAAAAGGAAYGLYEANKAVAPFRNLPAPKPRRAARQ